MEPKDAIQNWEHTQAILAWEDPPSPKLPRLKVDRVYAELKTRPMTWAKIYSGGWQLLMWYTPLNDYPDIQLDIIYTSDNGGSMGPRDVYARYTGASDG